MRARATRVRDGYSEPPPIDPDAVLTPAILTAVEGFDLLLATVTTPTPPYPTVETVIDAMGVGDPSSKGLRYFRENVRHGIATFQDTDIATALCARGVAI